MKINLNTELSEANPSAVWGFLLWFCCMPLCHPQAGKDASPTSLKVCFLGEGTSYGGINTTKACLTFSHCHNFPLSPPELFSRADQRCRMEAREGLPALGAASPGCPTLEHCWLGRGGAEGEQGSSTASSLISCKELPGGKGGSGILWEQGRVMGKVASMCQ